MGLDTKIFSRTDVHPVVLEAVLTAHLGPLWLSWDADSVFMAIERQFNTTLSRSNRSKIFALGVLHSNHSYWEDWRTFEIVSWALSGRQIDLAQMNPLTPTILLYGYRTSRWMDSQAALSPEVQAYIVTVFLQDQFSVLPQELADLQPAMFRETPHIKERADLVKSALASDAAGADMQEADTDPVRVELTRQRLLRLVMQLVCSQDFIQTQADAYKVSDVVAKVLSGGAL